MNNLSFSSQKINEYFNNESDDPPVHEFIYLEKYPLTNPSFIRQISEYISVRVQDNPNLLTKEFLSESVELANMMVCDTLAEPVKAGICLKVLRSLYQRIGKGL